MKKNNTELITKKDLNDLFNRLKNYIDYRLEPINDFGRFKDSVLKTLSWITGEIKDIKTEMMIFSSRYPKINDKIEEHDKRIEKLEGKLTN